MPVRRFLGAAFASVHGPSDERQLAVWTLDLGFSGLPIATTPRPIDWRALRAQLHDLPFTIPVARFASSRPGRSAGLASAKSGDRAAAHAEILEAGRFALAMGVSVLVLDPGRIPLGSAPEFDDLTEAGPRITVDAAAQLLERARPGRDQALDRVCRGLYELGRQLPDVTFALTPSSFVSGLGEPDALGAIYEDLAGQRLGYWHEPGISVCRNVWLGEEQGAWLERFADRMVGLTLSDGSATAVDLLPGAGLVDYGMVASYTRRSEPVPGVLDLDPAFEPSEIAGSRSFLSKFGL